MKRPARQVINQQVRYQLSLAATAPGRTQLQSAASVCQCSCSNLPSRSFHCSPGAWPSLWPSHGALLQVQCSAPPFPARAICANDVPARLAEHGSGCMQCCHFEQVVQPPGCTHLRCSLSTDLRSLSLCPAGGQLLFQQGHLIHALCHF